MGRLDAYLAYMLIALIAILAVITALGRGDAAWQLPVAGPSGPGPV